MLGDEITRICTVAICHPESGFDDGMPTKYAAYMIVRDPEKQDHFRYFHIAGEERKITDYKGTIGPYVEAAIVHLLGQYTGWKRIA